MFLRQLLSRPTTIRRQSSSPRRFSTYYTQKQLPQIPVEFPPSGRHPFLFLCALTLAYAITEISEFSESFERISDLGRRAKHGEGIFPAKEVARSLIELNVFAQDTISDAICPSNFPRILASGGKEGVIRGLQSENPILVSASAELASTLCSSPAVSKMLISNEAFAQGLVTALTNAVNVRDYFLGVALLSVLSHCVPYFPFDNSNLTEPLMQALVTLKRDSSNQDVIMDHAIKSWLLMISLRAPVGRGDFLFQNGKDLHFLEETQQDYYQAAKKEYENRHVVALGTQPQPARQSNSMRWNRFWLENENVIEDGITALFLGQVWGMFRTGLALRLVPPPAGEHVLLWRWKMMGRQGFLAGLGACAMVTLSHVVLKRDVAGIERDANQIGVFGCKMAIALVASKLLFQRCAYFLLPAILADNFVSWFDEVHTHEIFELSPFEVPPLPKKGNKPDDGSEWT